MGFRDNLLEGIKDGACSIMNSAGTAARWGAGAGFASSGAKGTVVSINLLATAGAAAGYFCNEDPLPQPQPGFTGGQCEGIRYTVNYSYEDWRNGSLHSVETAGIARVRGPITGIRSSVIGTQSSIIIEHSGGTTNARFETNSTISWLNPAITSVIREDGLPDDCGNPPIVVPPLTPEERTTTINVGGVSAQLAVGNGIVQVNGDVTAPIRVNSDDYEFTGELVLNKGDINLNFGGADPRRPCVPQEPETDLPPPEDDEPPPPEDDEPIIAGVIVTTTETTEARTTTTIFQTGNPDIYAPALGYISFRLKIGDVYAWTSDIPVKLLRNYIPAPGDFPAVAVAGTPRVGVTWELTPVKGVHPSIEVD